MQHAAELALSPAMIRRAIIASTIGNGLEWFDFLVFGSLAGVISQVFFPSGNHVASLILTWTTFGVGFVVRPFGGILLGMYADRAGRRKALALLIVLMAIGTFGLGITPGYATIGFAAPVIAVASRVLQGLSVGGEFPSATAMLVEYAPPGRKMFFGSFQMCSQALSIALSAGFAYAVTIAFSHAELVAWGWRIPFLIGGLVGPIGFYIRRRVAESPEFEQLVARLPRSERTPLGTLLTRYIRPLLCAIGVIVCGTASVYLWNIYLPVYVARTLHLPSTAPLLGATVCGFMNTGLTVAIGVLADRIGAWRVFLPALVVAGLMAVPLFAFIIAAPSLTHLFAVQLFASLVFAFLASPIPGLLAGMFPTAVRSTGMAVSYNASVALFGGLAPLTVSWLSSLTQSQMVPAYYLTAAAALSLVMVLAFRDQTQPIAAAADQPG